MIYIKLKKYLADLEDIEQQKPQPERRKVPSLRAIAGEIGKSYAAISRIANNHVNGIRFETANAIIETVRRQGFQMDLTDLITYVPKEESHAQG